MITWNVDPIIFSLGSFSLRWYSLGFLASFSLGYLYLKKRYEEGGLAPEKLESLLVHCVAGTIIGARLGHCFFYEPEVYLREPLKIFAVWEGGLASHGAAIGILLSLWFYCRRNHIGYLWLIDRVVIPVALAGGFIRLGNLMNSEIIGRPTDLPWAFIFQRVDEVPRHPSMVYESIFYFFSFALLHLTYKKSALKEKEGATLGLFLILIFGFRFFVEFLKEHQVDFESRLPLDMGQFLSIPFVLAGIYLMARPRKKKSPFQYAGSI